MSQFFARKVNFFLFHGIVTSARFFWGMLTLYVSL